MILTVKQLTQNGEIIVPQTTAEAVLVKTQSNVVTTLNRVLETKQNIITTPAGSGLSLYDQGNGAILTHSNNITVNSIPEHLLIQHDSHGHIIASEKIGSKIISVQNVPVINSNATQEQNLNFGDDFKLDQNNIKLNWNNL